MRRERRHMNRADQLVRNHGELLKEQYGFLAEVDKPLWYNVERRLGEMNCQEILSMPRNLKCHNLLENNPLPQGARALLGLGLNFCIRTDTTTETTNNTFSRLSNDVRRIYHLRDSPDQADDEYIKKLYIKSDWKFKAAPDHIEEALHNFERAIKTEQHKLQRRRKPTRNLDASQWNSMEFLRRNDDYIVVQGDKNLGSCIIDREVHNYKGCEQHLGNERNYKQLSNVEVERRMHAL